MTFLHVHALLVSMQEAFNMNASKKNWSLKKFHVGDVGVMKV